MKPEASTNERLIYRLAVGFSTFLTGSAMYGLGLALEHVDPATLEIGKLPVFGTEKLYMEPARLATPLQYASVAMAGLGGAMLFARFRRVQADFDPASAPESHPGFH